MDTLINFIINNANYAHWIIFGSLLLAGFNIPISEDLMIIISALLASTIIPEKMYLIMAFLFMGCFFSDIILYWLSRTLGRRLLKVPLFKKTLPEKRIAKIENFYKKYGVPTLIVGRFIPFGVRNCLFITAGLTKMRFIKFFIGDGIACMLSNATLFFLAYFLGKNHEVFLKYLKTFNLFIFILFIVSLFFVIWLIRKKRRKAKIEDNQNNENES